jgi:hypothetical protein
MILESASAQEEKLARRIVAIFAIAHHQPGNKATRRKTARSPTQTPEQRYYRFTENNERDTLVPRKPWPSYLKSLQIKRDILGPDHFYGEDAQQYWERHLFETWKPAMAYRSLSHHDSEIGVGI